VLEETQKSLAGVVEVEAVKSTTLHQKTLTERVSESLEAMLSWIKSVGGEQEVILPSSFHVGPVKNIDDLHCVQKTGRLYAIHRLTELDNLPALDDPKIEIKYKNGVGQVKGKLGQIVER
jgi:hypothetical protein